MVLTRIYSERDFNMRLRRLFLPLSLGYELLRAKRLRESLAVFALNAELYPQSFNVYDSLAGSRQ